jgi:malonyl-CoA O-methyltransferase
MEGIFVAGVDTNVGKTAVCAGLMKLLDGHKTASYWKPIQTGTIVGDDTKDVQALTGLGPDSFLEPSYRFAEPLAPRDAAKKWGKTIEISEIVAGFRNRADKSRLVVVEGAGGLLVPLNEQSTQKDLIVQLGLPVLLISEDRMGAINHTLLTIEACRTAKIQVAGVILTKCRGSHGNAESISHFGKVEVLAELPPYEDSRTVIAQVSCNERLRRFFEVPPMPR